MYIPRGFQMSHTIELLTHQLEGQRVAFATTACRLQASPHSVGMCTYHPVWRGQGEDATDARRLVRRSLSLCHVV